MKKLLENLQIFILKFDIYGHEVLLYLNKEAKVKSKLGSFISIVILAICIISFSDNYISWRDNLKLQIISSTKSFSVTELWTKNQSYTYELDHQNYDLFYNLEVSLNDSVDRINFEALQIYFLQSFSYIDQTGIEQIFEFEKCLLRNRRQFLLNFTADDKIYNKTSNYSVCIKENLKFILGLVADSEGMQVYQPTLTYRITKCKNSTENYFSCAPVEELEKILQFVTVQSSVPRSIYDFNDPQSPRKRTYTYKTYNLDLQNRKSSTATLIPTYLYTDVGYFNENYILDSVDFNVEDMDYEFFSGDSKKDILFEQNYCIGLDRQIYYRKNDRLNTLIGNFGGIVHILFILGRVICYYYNNLILKHKLINFSFENLESNNSSQSLTSLKK